MRERERERERERGISQVASNEIWALGYKSVKKLKGEIYRLFYWFELKIRGNPVKTIIERICFGFIHT
jgi:hypothetical protein